MELKQLEAFVAVVDYNSFSEAARHLFLTQPTVSAHVASLEKELDTKLISRTTKKLHVTPQGYDLYDSAVSMLKIRDHILNEFVGSHKQIIELGASTIPSSYVLPEVAQCLRQLNPDIYFHSELSDSMGIIQQVENGRLDFGLVGMTTDSSELIFIPFLEDELVIVTPVTPHYLENFQRKCNHCKLFLMNLLFFVKKVPVQKKPSTSILNSSILHREPSML